MGASGPVSAVFCMAPDSRTGPPVPCTAAPTVRAGAAAGAWVARTPVPGHPVCATARQVRGRALRSRNSVSTVSISGEW
ncbi:hypothetical protein GCM10010211_13870 [Streptomyces albospinus]|uniref:Uncharacterized protein n=1 Tax=Streptomyces albospinus TaxID=285515 RepID=A0ABQ2URV4_9ACTN|nr:hypothetical protein GCM10010211_13870 [Streptomyces albospinus]